MEYQVGQVVKLETVGEMRVSRSGRDFIMVCDDKSQYPVYNILKCQYEDFPPFLNVEVRSIDINGRPSFRQDFPTVYKEHYIAGSVVSFYVTGSQKDQNDKLFYTIEDDFAEHRFYTDRTYHIGEDIKLKIDFAKNGFLLFTEVVSNPHLGAESTAMSIANPRKESSPRINLGPEDMELEYKTSIIFSASTNQPDIQEQMLVIIKVLASFMNTNGGCLAIGITDEDHIIRGIDADYEYLNSDSDDNFTYKLNEDGYKLKILHDVNYRCGSLAASTLRFDFKERDNKRYLKINVTKAERPVWVREGSKGSVLYIRQDGRCKPIYGEDITNYITSRMHESMMKGNYSTEEYFEKFEEMLKKLMNQREHKEDIELPTPPVRDIQYWLMWNNDGTWKKLNAPDQSASLQIPVYKSDKKNQRIMQCYADAKIVTRDVTKMVPQRVHNNEEQRSNWRVGKKPTNIFIAYANDYIAIQSVDAAGNKYIKLHSVGHFNTIEAANAEGRTIIPTNGYKVMKYAIVGAEHSHRVKQLVLESGVISSNVGIAQATLSADLQVYINALLA
jgi:hypothetical protein